MRRTIADVLGAHRNQWTSAESIFQGQRSSRSTQCGRTRHFHFGATLRFDRKTEETVKIDPKLQRIYRAIMNT